MPQDLDLLDGLDIVIPTDPGQTSSAPDAGATFFGPYQIIQEVGEGGVAKVMRARHIHPHYADKMFAVKVLHEELSADPKVVALFRREAYVLSLLNHPNVVQTFEAGAQDNKLFIAMEYIDGRDLDNMLMRSQAAKLALPLPIQMHILGEVILALTYAHELVDHDNQRLNLIHRDVNPANVFVAYDGRIKLGDFGVASITAGRVEKSREIAGKVGYFAPEQLSGDAVDHRADLFAMGVMMFEMLCGTRLFDAEDADKALRLNRQAKIPKPSKLNPNIPAGLERAMLKALERKPNDRFSSGRDMLQALAPFIPDRAGMRLAVAALMRRVFLSEHIQELQLREGLAGRSPGRGDGRLIHVYTHDDRARVAFVELLQSRGYRVAAFSEIDALCDSVSVELPSVILVDVSGDGFAAEDFNAVARNAGSPIPVVAVSQGLDTDSIRLADAVRAADLIFKPFSIERVLTAVRGAMLGHAQSQHDEPEEAAVYNFVRILLVSDDETLVKNLRVELLNQGYTVDVVATAAAALEHAGHHSSEAVIYDAHPAGPADRLFVSQYRSGPGISLVPMVYLVDEAGRSMFRGMLIDRSQVMSRKSTGEEIHKVIVDLQENTRAGRSFLRYEVDVPAEIRYGGRVFTCTAINASRGGVMLQCDHIPPVGTDVGVSLRFPMRPPVEGNGKVIRVNLVKASSHDAAQVGVVLHHFAGNGESELITFIRLLENAKAAQSEASDIAAAFTSRLARS